MNDRDLQIRYDKMMAQTPVNLECLVPKLTFQVAKSHVPDTFSTRNEAVVACNSAMTLRQDTAQEDAYANLFA
ncbi:MAG TPA: hypothetical protein V6C81_16425 [Planktothrix sp.]|jgi:hypothetical protein